MSSVVVYFLFTMVVMLTSTDVLNGISLNVDIPWHQNNFQKEQKPVDLIYQPTDFII